MAKIIQVILVDRKSEDYPQVGLYAFADDGQVFFTHPYNDELSWKVENPIPLAVLGTGVAPGTTVSVAPGTRLNA